MATSQSPAGYNARDWPPFAVTVDLVVLTVRDGALSALVVRVPGATVKAVAESVRQPLERGASAELFARAQRHAVALGQPVPEGVAVGGASDGNLTAAIGVPTLDGLGAVGGNAHAEGEWASASALAERTALVAALVIFARLLTSRRFSRKVFRIQP